MAIKIGTSSVQGVYVGADEAVKVYLGDTEVYPTTPSPPTPPPTGLTVFTTSGEIEIPEGITTLEYLVIGAGGGGGSTYAPAYLCENRSGSGGGGGWVSGVTTNIVAGTYQVIVGSGGTGSSGDGILATNGGNSSFSGITAIGGGHGANGKYLTLIDGTAGGNGGGGSSSGGFSTPSVFKCNNTRFAQGGSGVAGQGVNAATIIGGGSGDVGVTFIAGWLGKNGKNSDITGSVVQYSMGGAYPTGYGDNPYSHAANTGGGGYGNRTVDVVGTRTGGNGQAGIVVIKYY